MYSPPDKRLVMDYSPAAVEKCAALRGCWAREAAGAPPAVEASGAVLDGVCKLME